MSRDLLALEGVTKRYRQGPAAVDDVTLRVRAGETVALVGESGSGKSTLARLALGLLSPDSGTVRFDGHDPHRLRGRAGRPVRARLQFVPQHPRGSLNPALPAGHAVTFTLRVHGTPRADRPEIVADLFRKVGLDPALARRHPHALSGGQLQRVAIARALATGPDLIVCDEPTSALDSTVQAQVLDLLTGLQRRLGLALLFISHDLGVVRDLAHRVVVLRHGRVVEEAPTDTLWRTPAHAYTRALLAADTGGSTGSPTPTSATSAISAGPATPARPATSAGPATSATSAGPATSATSATPATSAGPATSATSARPTTPAGPADAPPTPSDSLGESLER